MTKPASIDTGVVFDLSRLAGELRDDPVYRRNGHTARTLVRAADLRVVLIVLSAGSRMAEHRADETASIHLLSGQLQLALPERTVELRPGQLLVLERGIAHDVTSVTDSEFLLTLGWSASAGD